jgi:serine/threonine-protein kinase HipA
MIYDEEYGARIMRHLGLLDYRTWIADFAGTPALVIERYDRSDAAPLGRVHQEDFSQILGVSGNQKYQRFGGRASLGRIAKTLAENCEADTVEKLFDMTVAAVAIGNLDMHAKNISVMHHPDGAMSLAPAYDFVPQTHLPNDDEMSLAINGKYPHRFVSLEDLSAEAASWAVPVTGAAARAATIVDQIHSFAVTEAPHPNAHAELVINITGFCTNLLKGKAAAN